MARTKCPAYVVRNPSGVVQTTATYFVYSAGGVVEADVYAAESGGSPLAQPISVDGQARIIFYADAGVYDIHVTVGGDTTITEDVQLGEFQQYSPDDIPGPVTIDGTLDVEPAGAEAGLVFVNGSAVSYSLRINDIGVGNLAESVIHKHSTTFEPVLLGIRANSDTASHAAVTAGMNVFSVYAGGWCGSQYNTMASIAFAAGATGTISNTSSPGRIDVNVARDGSITPTVAVRVNELGRVLVNTTTDNGADIMQVAGSAAVSTSVKTPLVTNAGTLDLSATGANAIILSTNGTEALRVTSAQRVGAGTNTPTSPVHVAGAASIDTTGSTGKWTIKAQDTTTSAAGVGGGVLFSGNKSAAGAVGNFGGIAGVKENGTNNNEQGALVMYTTPSSGVMVEAARISSNQRFLIGTTTDDGSNLLQVNGNTALMGQTLTLGGTTYNGVINNFASIRININSDASGSGEHFTVGKDQTTMSEANVLFRVLQVGRALFNTTTDDGVGTLQVNGPITHSPGASVTPANNGQITFEFTNNTTLTFKGKGSDGTVRTATLTLA